MEFYPDILSGKNGPVTTAAEWEERKKEVLTILSREEYGFMPAAPERVWGEVTDTQRKCCGGHGIAEFINIHFDTPGGEFSFPIRFIYPTRQGKHPTFVLLNFRSDLYDMYCPLEEIIDRGYAVAQVNYRDITNDDDNFNDGIAGLYPRDGSGAACGKIGMWAFGASRIADYLLTRDEVDKDNLAVIGHSRLGKTALWCGANDERFKFTISNGSGCSGAAYERVKIPEGETIKQILGLASYWFCDNYKKYGDRPDDRDFDQHFLLALCAPRYVLIGAANRDFWADQYGEQLSCMAASPVWSLYGKEGYIGKTGPPQTGDSFSSGEIHYHLRDGMHFLSRRDWISYMDYIDRRVS